MTTSDSKTEMKRNFGFTSRFRVELLNQKSKCQKVSLLVSIWNCGFCISFRTLILIQLWLTKRAKNDLWKIHPDAFGWKNGDPRVLSAFCTGTWTLLLDGNIQEFSVKQKGLSLIFQNQSKNN